MKRIPIALFTILIAACSTQPKQSGSTAAPAADTLASATDNSGVTPEMKAYLRKRGYRTVQRQGKTVFCRSGVPTGSYLTSEVCLTEAQLQQEERTARELGDSLRRNGTSGPICTPQDCQR